MSKPQPSAFMKAAVQKVVDYAGKSGSNRGPIVIVTGERSSAEVLIFLNALLNRMRVGDRLRSFNHATHLMIYVESDPHPDPIFYRDDLGMPTPAAQAWIASRCSNPLLRHRLPGLFLVAVTHFPSAHPRPEIPSHALVPEFAAHVGARIVDVSPSAEQAAMTGHAPLSERLKRLFLAVVSRKGGPATEPEAEALIGDALKQEATTSTDEVMKLAAACRARAKENGTERVSREDLWELFPPRFREVVQPSEATVQ